MELLDELNRVVDRLNESGVDYALCGGLALAVHGCARATQDIDVLTMEADVPRIASLARELGFDIEVGWMELGKGAIKLFRLTKIDPKHHDVIPLDILAVTPALTGTWSTRRKVVAGGREIRVVSAKGLIAMKRMSGRTQDLADIERLEAADGQS